MSQSKDEVGDTKSRSAAIFEWLRNVDRRDRRAQVQAMAATSIRMDIQAADGNAIVKQERKSGEPNG
jgi:hypothetical protein